MDVEALVDLEVRRAHARTESRVDGIVTQHAFSFGNHYDPDNVSFGALVAYNEELLAPGAGYDDHPHRDVEILTWPLSGVLRHADSAGRINLVRPGEVQYTGAGAGVTHSERNGSTTEPARFVQIWLEPDASDAEPTYAHRSLPTSYGEGAWLTVAAGDIWGGDSGGGVAEDQPLIRIRCRAARLRARRLFAGRSELAFAGSDVHLSVAAGSVTIDGIGALNTGDTVRARFRGDSAPGAVAASSDGADLLVWEMHRDEP